MESTLARWRGWARAAKAEVHALLLAYRDPRTPWYARLVAALVAGYALSPLDLIPDFIPVLGYLDDLVLLPLGVLLARRLIPPEVLAECRARAGDDSRGGKGGKVAAGAIVLAWLAIGALVAALAARAYGR